jgi:hypothetical protein
LISPQIPASQLRFARSYRRGVLRTETENLRIAVKPAQS